jgi:hypothetical protein
MLLSCTTLDNSDQQYASIELEQSDQPDEEPDDIFGAEEVEDNVSQTSGGTETPESQQQGTKPKDHVAVLVDDKRKHLEHRLSASQRDALLLKEAKEDREERKEFRDMLKNANDSFVHALNNMSQSMLSINNAIARSMETFSNTAHSRAICHYLTMGLNSNKLNSNRMGIFSYSQPGQCFMKAINEQTLLKFMLCLGNF